MKAFRSVEENRKNYHQNSSKNSVHRASLIIPEIPNSDAYLSFLNHFLIKRNYPHVACRVTAIDAQGQRIESRLFPITEAKVYSFKLKDIFEVPAASYLIDFFSPQNLFIPFPACMINHQGENFLNVVHSYNRVLNDIFEDDSINANMVRESSIDCKFDANTNPFVMFASGNFSVNDSLDFDFTREDQAPLVKSIKLNVPRLSNSLFKLSDVFGEDFHKTSTAKLSGILRVKQPRQSMFYGRMLVGQLWKDGAWSANHSYYDSSETKEYWDNQAESKRQYPFFPHLQNIVRMYPIMSPGQIGVSIVLHDHAGENILKIPHLTLQSPGREFLDISINLLAEKYGIQAATISTFEVVAFPIQGNTPTRINHQLIFSAGALEASINMSLVNANVYVPPGKLGKAWGQIPVDPQFETDLGITTNTSDGIPTVVELMIYNEAGFVGKSEMNCPAGGSIQINIKNFLKSFAASEVNELSFHWYMINSNRPDISAYVVTRHLTSHHCTGEHHF
jgi:hypothetical protein